MESAAGSGEYPNGHLGNNGSQFLAGNRPAGRLSRTSAFCAFTCGWNWSMLNELQSEPPQVVSDSSERTAEDLGN